MKSTTFDLKAGEERLGIRMGKQLHQRQIVAQAALELRSGCGIWAVHRDFGDGLRIGFFEKSVTHASQVLKSEAQMRCGMIEVGSSVAGMMCMVMLVTRSAPDLFIAP